MIREIARYDVETARRVFRWPLREALLAYYDLLRRRAVDHHRNALLQWASLAATATKKLDPPQMPAILREVIIDG